MVKKSIFLFLFLFSNFCFAAKTILPGAEQYQKYLPLLKNKRVAVFANQTSLVGKIHLVDFLQKNQINVVKIFEPEHGYRGNATAGTRLQNDVDNKTGIPILSLYGKRTKPNAEDLKNVDIIVFDIQDVGVRFFTYISSLQRLMEGALENNKPIIILDRPNPNGFYVDGPVLDLKYKTFTGMQPIPVVYGMTMGEYAKMLIGEKWLDVQPKSKAKNLQLTIIPCKNYTHKSLYIPPVPPSPNLPNINSIYLYPAIGLMEATAMSVGRGTNHPFQEFGHPKIHKKFVFIPHLGKDGEHPDFENQTCHGWNLIGTQKDTLKKINHHLQIKYLIAAYKIFHDKKHFFTGFSSMAGTPVLLHQIKAGMSETKIRQSWQAELNKFKKIRQKYLIYS